MYSFSYSFLIHPHCSNFPNREFYSSLVITRNLVFKGQLQRFYKLVSYERAVNILKNDICITEIGQAVLKIFEFKVKFPRKVPKIRNFEMSA